MTITRFDNVSMIDNVIWWSNKNRNQLNWLYIVDFAFGIFEIDWNLMKWNDVLIWRVIWMRVLLSRCMKNWKSIIAIQHLQYLTKWKNFGLNKLAMMSFIDCATLKLSNGLMIQRYCDDAVFFSFQLFLKFLLVTWL